jgi:hypothetical protein
MSLWDGRVLVPAKMTNAYAASVPWPVLVLLEFTSHSPRDRQACVAGEQKPAPRLRGRGPVGRGLRAGGRGVGLSFVRPVFCAAFGRL